MKMKIDVTINNHGWLDSGSEGWRGRCGWRLTREEGICRGFGAIGDRGTALVACFFVLLKNHVLNEGLLVFLY